MSGRYLSEEKRLPLGRVGVSDELGSNKVGKGEGGLPSLEEVGVHEVLSVGKLLCQGSKGEMGDLKGTWGKEGERGGRQGGERVRGEVDE